MSSQCRQALAASLTALGEAATYYGVGSVEEQTAHRKVLRLTVGLQTLAHPQRDRVYDALALEALLDNLVDWGELNRYAYVPYGTLEVPTVRGDLGDSGGGVDAADLAEERLLREAGDATLADELQVLSDTVATWDWQTAFDPAYKQALDVAIANQHTHSNGDVLDQIDDGLIQDIGLNTAHRGQGDLHLSASDRSKLADAVDSSTVNHLISSYPVPPSQVTGLEASLQQLQQDIAQMAGVDGVTPTFQVGSVSQGMSPTVTLDPTSTSDRVILNFVLAKGDKGDPGAKGDAFSFDITDTLANRGNYIASPSGTTYYHTDRGTYSIKLVDGEDLWSPEAPLTSLRGWTPLHRYVPGMVNGEPVLYQQLVDYVGGQGAKPDQYIGWYVADVPTGYVVSLAGALNFRGSRGRTPEAFRDYTPWLPGPTVTVAAFMMVRDSDLGTQPRGHNYILEDPGETLHGRLMILDEDDMGQRYWRSVPWQGIKGDTNQAVEGVDVAPAETYYGKGPDGQTGWFSATHFPQKTPTVVGNSLVFSHQGAVYGAGSPEAGLHYEFDLVNSHAGVSMMMIHNGPSGPTFGAPAKQLDNTPAYVPGKDNYIYMHYVTDGLVLYSINQGVSS